MNRVTTACRNVTARAPGTLPVTRTRIRSTRVTGASPFNGTCAILSSTSRPSIDVAEDACTCRRATARLADDDEERRRGARRIVAARHRQNPLHVLRVVELRLKVVDERLLFLGQRTARAQSSRSARRTRDDTMKRRAVENARLREPKKIAHVLGRLVRKEADGDRPRATSRAPRDTARAVRRSRSRTPAARAEECRGSTTLLISTRSRARPLSSAGVSEILRTTFNPSLTRPKSGVLTGQRRLIGDAHEKLRAAAVRIAGTYRGRDGARRERLRCSSRPGARRVRPCRTARSSRDPSRADRLPE